MNTGMCDTTDLVTELLSKRVAHILDWHYKGRQGQSSETD